MTSLILFITLPMRSEILFELRGHSGLVRSAMIVTSPITEVVNRTILLLDYIIRLYCEVGRLDIRLGIRLYSEDIKTVSPFPTFYRSVYYNEIRDDDL